MTSILCGLMAACCWAGVNVLATRVVRDSESTAFAFWFSFIELLLCVPPGLLLLSSANVSLSDVLWLALAGVGMAAAGRLLALAFRKGQLSVIGPLMSLEGAVAATLGIAVVGGASSLVAVGLVASAAGGLVVAFGAGRRGHLIDSYHALPAAVGAGVALWAFTREPLSPLLALMITRVFGTAALVPTVSSWARPAHLRWIFVVVVLDGIADVLFLLGARAGSLPATAVLAAQFGTLTAIGGVLRLKESLSRIQIAGLLILGAGVTVIAAS
jgi:drug/metabolite transporter (DMT)-like permease